MQRHEGQDSFNWRQFIVQSEEERRSTAAALLRSQVPNNPLISNANAPNDIPLTEVIINTTDDNNEWDRDEDEIKEKQV